MIIFSVLAALALIDSVTMVVTDTTGLAIGFGSCKLIHSLLQGLALAATPSSKIYFTLGSFTAQLGVIWFFVFFACLARYRSVRGYVIGIIAYALDALPTLFNADFATAGLHLLLLPGLVAGLIRLRRKPSVVQELNTSQGTARQPTGAKLVPFAGWAAGCGGLLIATAILTVLGFWIGNLAVDSQIFYADMEQRILERAPADLTEAEGLQLHRAMVDLAMLESQGHVNMASSHDIRKALELAVAGETVGREDILRVIRVIEEAKKRTEGLQRP